MTDSAFWAMFLFSVSMCVRETHILLQLWLEENTFLLLFSLILSISFSPSLSTQHFCLSLFILEEQSSTKQSIVWGSIWETDSTVL